MSSFMNLLINYNKVRLLNDYFHVKRYHLQSASFLEHLKERLVSTKCVSLEDTDRERDRVCLQWHRNEQKREMYRLYPSEKRRSSYFITPDSNIRESSNAEMHEMNLQQFLDSMHSHFVHKCISDGNKFVNAVSREGDGGGDGDDDKEEEEEEEDDKEEDVVTMTAPDFAFGVGFDHWNNKKGNFVKAKQSNLKNELLRNSLYKMDKNDYNMLWFKSKDFVSCNEGRYMVSRRIKERSKITKMGRDISLEHVMALILYCNYDELAAKLKRGCVRKRGRLKLKRESLEATKRRHSEVANWCRLLIESVYCFGERLGDDQFLYHLVDCKLAVNAFSTQFNLPTSTTSKLLVAKSFSVASGSRQRHGLCLKLSRASMSMSMSSGSGYLNVSHFSRYPNEYECLVYGDRFYLEDIMLLHRECMLSMKEQLGALKLYYSMIRGRWYTQNKQHFKKKNQREIMRMITKMMTKQTEQEQEGDIAAKYIQCCFESMTKTIRKNVIWVNRNGAESLLPDLRKLFHDEFLQHLRANYNVKTRYGEVVVLETNKEEIAASSRENAIFSAEYKHPVNVVGLGRNIDDVVLSFRCYKKLDVAKQEMVLKAEFVVKPFSNRIAAIKLSGGVWFPQIPGDVGMKWDFCTFTHSKRTKGSSLFPLKLLERVNEPFVAKICFQIKEILPAKTL